MRRTPPHPGLVVLSAANDVELITAPARELIEALRRPKPGRERRDAAHAAARPGLVRARPRARHRPTARHRRGPQLPRLERANSPHATAVRLETDGVTVREPEVATLLAQGLSNPEIAATLVLSPYTVQDHIKNLFEKTGVASRQELVARVFLDGYMPHVSRGTPLTSAGGFARPEPGSAWTGWAAARLRTRR